jgi:RND family efflux transporter MFP subunit
MKNTVWYITILAMTLAGLLLSGCNEEKKTATPPPPPKVTVATPTVQDVVHYRYFTGYTEAQKSIELRARVEGNLESFTFQPGALVKKGDLLFTIDPKPLEADVAKVVANLKTRQAEEKLADATLKRKESAYKQKAVSELAVLEARAELSKAKSQVQEAQAELVSAQLQLSYTKIYAPEHGRISRNLVDVGNLVGTGGDKTLLATLVLADPIHVYFNMDERSFLLFKNYFRENGKELRKDKVTVDLALEGDSSFPYSGVGDYLANELDLATGTILARATFPNSDLFIVPGFFAKIRIPISDPTSSLLVPEVAISSDQRGRFLLTVASDGTVEYKPIEIGPLVSGMRVIKKGIKEDDRVIIKGIQRARPGAKVTPQTAKD